MKIQLLSILFILPTRSLFGQENITLSSDSDTAFWYGYKNEYVARFKLGLIEKDTCHYSFRFWSHGMTMKVASSKGNFFGEIVRFVEEYPVTAKKVFKTHYIIPTDKIIRLLSLIDSFQIRDLPSDKNIKGWQQGLDGVEYFVEYKQNNQYAFKNYWSPAIQDSVKEALQLQTFIASLSEILDLKTINKKFEADIPFNGWTYPGSASTVMRVKPKSTKKKNGS